MKKILSTQLEQAFLAVNVDVKTNLPLQVNGVRTIVSINDTFKKKIESHVGDNMAAIDTFLGALDQQIRYFKGMLQKLEIAFQSVGNLKKQFLNPDMIRDLERKPISELRVEELLIRIMCHTAAYGSILNELSGRVELLADKYSEIKAKYQELNQLFKGDTALNSPMKVVLQSQPKVSELSRKSIQDLQMQGDYDLQQLSLLSQMLQVRMADIQKQHQIYQQAASEFLKGNSFNFWESSKGDFRIIHTIAGSLMNPGTNISKESARLILPKPSAVEMVNQQPIAELLALKEPFKQSANHTPIFKPVVQEKPVSKPILKSESEPAKSAISEAIVFATNTPAKPVAEAKPIEQEPPILKPVVQEKAVSKPIPPTTSETRKTVTTEVAFFALNTPAKPVAEAKPIEQEPPILKPVVQEKAVSKPIPPTTSETRKTVTTETAFFALKKLATPVDESQSVPFQILQDTPEELIIRNSDNEILRAKIQKIDINGSTLSKLTPVEIMRLTQFNSGDGQSKVILQIENKTVKNVILPKN